MQLPQFHRRCFDLASRAQTHIIKWQAAIINAVRYIYAFAIKLSGQEIL